MTDLSKIVDGLLAISLWPWSIAEGNFIVYDLIANKPNTGRILAEVPCQGGSLADLNFITASPVWLAELVVALVEERAFLGQPERINFLTSALHSFNLTKEKYEELKRRLESSVQSGQRDVL